MKRLRRLATIVASIGIACASALAQVNVGAGSSWSLGDAAIDWGCSDVAVNGTLDVQAAVTANADSVLINGGGAVSGGTGTLGLTGDFTNNGTFAKGTGTVAIRDGCANTTSTIAGSQSFNALAVTTSTAKTLLFSADSTTSVGAGLLTLRGTAGNLLKIRSTSPGSQARMFLNGTQNIGYVDVADNRGTLFVLAPGAPAASNSVNSGNVMNWFDVLPIIPTLSTLGLILLGLLVAAFGVARAGRKHNSTSGLAP